MTLTQPLHDSLKKPHTVPYRLLAFFLILENLLLDRPPATEGVEPEKDRCAGESWPIFPFQAAARGPTRHFVRPDDPAPLGAHGMRVRFGPDAARILTFCNKKTLFGGAAQLCRGKMRVPTPELPAPHLRQMGHYNSRSGVSFDTSNPALKAGTSITLLT